MAENSIRCKNPLKKFRNFFPENFPEIYGINFHVEIYGLSVLFALVKGEYDTVWDSFIGLDVDNNPVEL